MSIIFAKTMLSFMFTSTTMLCFMLASTTASAFVANNGVPGRADDGPIDHRNTNGKNSANSFPTFNSDSVDAPRPTDTVLRSGQYVTGIDAPMSNLDVPNSMGRTTSDRSNTNSNANVFTPFVGIEKNLGGG